MNTWVQMARETGPAGTLETFSDVFLNFLIHN